MIKYDNKWQNIQDFVLYSNKDTSHNSLIIMYWTIYWIMSINQTIDDQLVITDRIIVDQTFDGYTI